jgi:putative holliday junction resolvase
VAGNFNYSRIIFHYLCPQRSNKLGRIIGIDYGTKRVGVAVTDPLHMIASGLITVGSHEILDFLSKYMLTETIDAIVLGLPKKMNNTDSESLQYVRQFETALKRKFPGVPIKWVDERFTSHLAMDAMIRGGMKKKDRQVKANLDKISAAIILQTYLEQLDFSKINN